MKIKDNKKKECWAEKQQKNGNLNEYLQNKPIKQEKGSNTPEEEESV